VICSATRSKELRNVRYWHLADIEELPMDVRFWSKADIEVKGVYFANDPKRTSRVLGAAGKHNLSELSLSGVQRRRGKPREPLQSQQLRRACFRD
jgi:hypothetical protein